MIFTPIYKSPLIALALLGASFSTALAAGAAEKSWTVSGQSLSVQSPCARTVSIEPSSDLTDKVEVKADAKNAEEIDLLSVTDGSVATIKINASRCFQTGPHISVGSGAVGVVAGPTLALKIRVPAGFGIAVQEGGSGNYVIGDVGGNLALQSSGSGNVIAKSAKDLTVALTGSGDAAIEQVDGALDSKQSGSGNLKIVRLNAAKTNLVKNGSGDLNVAQGQAGILSARLGGSGNVILPDVGESEFDQNGSGDIRVRKLEGKSSLRLHGSGKFNASSINAPSFDIDQTGSSDVEIRGGTVGALKIAAVGSGNIMLRIVADSADINLTGSGDIHINKVTGSLNRNNRGSGTIQVSETH